MKNERLMLKVGHFRKQIGKYIVEFNDEKASSSQIELVERIVGANAAAIPLTNDELECCEKIVCETVNNYSFNKKIKTNGDL